MGAPAVRTPARRPRTQAKPRPASKRATVQGSAAARKPRAAATRTATKSRPKARAASPARRTARPATRRPAASGGGGVIAFPAVAVGRTAHAVSGLADCGLVTGMARSRAWIGVLGVLLAGIVAVNVIGLSLSASNSAVAAKIDAIERDNSVQRHRIAGRSSTERIQQEATALGLAIPDPDAIHYLNAGGGDAAVAAKRLAAGEIGAAAPIDETTEPVDPATVVAAEPTIDPVTGATIDPATGLPIDPATGAPVVTDPATVTTADATAVP